MRKRLLLASISLGTLAIGLGGEAQANCRFGEPSDAGIRVGCRDEFQQVLRYNPETRRLTLTSQSGGTPSVLDNASFGRDDRISVIGNNLAGDDILELETVGVGNSINLAGGADVVIVDEATISGTVLGGAGDDRFTVRSTDALFGGTAFNGGSGNDLVQIGGGTVGGFVGGTGDDTLRFTGGEINGRITGFEAVSVTGSAVSSKTLRIRGAGDTTVSVSDVFAPEAGEGAPVALGLDLAGVSALRITNSTAGLLATDGLDELRLEEAVLRIGSSLDLTGSGRDGRLILRNSTLDSSNDNAGDILRVSGAKIANSTFIIDAGTTSGGNIADQLLIDTRGTDVRRNNRVSGDNTLIVNFNNGFTGRISGISVAEALGIGANDVLDALATFNVVGGTNSNPLQGITLERDENGDLVLRADESDNAAITNQITTSTVADFASGAVDDIATDLAEGGGDRVQVSDQFGVFASGQFGHTWHNGYDVTDGTIDSRTSDFEVDNYSAFLTGEVDFGELPGNSEIGLRVAAFGGYVQSDVTLDRDLGGGLGPSPFEGSGTNRGGMFGGTVSFDRVFGAGHYAYAGTTAAGFFGRTDVTNAGTGFDGDYDTGGVVITNKFGIAFAIADKLRLDTRFGIGYTYFEGDAFTDEGGVEFGKSRVSYATLSFEPGLQTAVPVGGFVLTPQARLLLDYKAGYVNTGSQDNVTFDFDESPFSIGGEVGAGLLLTKNLTAGAFFSAKTSEDYTSLLGRLAVKYQF